MEQITTITPNVYYIDLNNDDLTFITTETYSKGDLIVFIEQNFSPRVKIADGHTTIINLDFINEFYVQDTEPVSVMLDGNYITVKPSTMWLDTQNDNKTLKFKNGNGTWENIIIPFMEDSSKFPLNKLGVDVPVTTSQSIPEDFSKIHPKYINSSIITSSANLTITNEHDGKTIIISGGDTLTFDSVDNLTETEIINTTNTAIILSFPSAPFIGGTGNLATGTAKISPYETIVAKFVNGKWYVFGGIEVI